MNSLMEDWCDRPGQQAWVEQKNGMLVRRVVGYQRVVSFKARPDR
ncbi:MAG: hypothetical protein NTW51_14535 [Cyanobacteria bacterium]|nr:hypothetical protein [Cyanobacteriota bacterium]